MIDLALDLAFGMQADSCMTFGMAQLQVRGKERMSGIEERNDAVDS